MKVILQNTQADCLLACASMIMSTYGCNVPVYRLLERVELSMAGSNVLQLKEVLGEFGFVVDGYKINNKDISNSILPVIAYVNNSHFIVIEKVKRSKVIGIDPAIGRISYTYEEFNNIYSGVVIKLIRNEKITNIENINYVKMLGFLKDNKLIKILFCLLITAIFTQIVAMSYTYMYSAVGNGEDYFKLFSLVLLAALLLGCGSVIQGYLTNKFNIIYEQIYGNRLVNKLVSKSFKFFTFRSNGDLLYRINARGMIKDALLLKIVPSFIALCTIILIQGLLFNKNLILGILLLAAITIYLLVYLMISRISYMESNKYTQKIIKLNTTSENMIRAISTIKVLDVENVFIKKWQSENQEQASRYGQLVILQSIQSLVTNIFTYIVPIVISITNIIINRDGDVFSQMALLPLLYLVVQNAVTIALAINSLYNVLPNIDKTNELLDEEFMKDRARIFAKLDRDEIISIKKMSYHYGSVMCLENVNLQLKKGRKYAVIGLSGSGKSTLLKILASLLNDYQGEILYDSLHMEKPVYLDQDTSILDSTILENVLFGQECTEERLIAVSEATGLDQIINQLPKNWGTEISKGKNLSRGQEQRICLARCLIKNAEIYLLDEATSNIDIIDEEKIIRNLIGSDGVLSDKTVLVSTHKLSMLKYVDEIIYISEKRVYQGTHDEILKVAPSYADFFI